MSPVQVRGVNSLRAVGLVLVVIYHFYSGVLPGGFFGVDMFFVISGFLVTGLFAAEYREKGYINLPAFFARRIRRLLPACAFMVVVTLSAAFLISADFRVGIRSQAAAVFGWVTNYYEITAGQSYEDQFLPHFFVHTWTLAVEMQYYIIWGIAAAVLYRIFGKGAGGRVAAGFEERRRAAARFLAVLAAVFGILAYFHMQALQGGAADPSPAYYATTSRLYPLMIGSVLGALTGLRLKTKRMPAPFSAALLAVSIVLFISLARILSFSDPDTYRWGILTASALTAVMLYMLLCLQHSVHFREIPLIGMIGKRSYSIYLFHWPVYNILKQMAQNGTGPFPPDAPKAAYVIPTVILTILLAEISYRCFEWKPAARAKKAPASPRAPGQAPEQSPASPRASGQAPDSPRTSGQMPDSPRTSGQSGQPVQPRAGQSRQSQHASRQLRRRRSRAAVVLVCAVVFLTGGSVCALWSAPDKTFIEDDFKHQQVLLNIWKMDEYDAYLSGLEMNPVLFHAAEGSLPETPTARAEREALEAEQEQEQLDAKNADQRDDPEGPVVPIRPPGGANITLIGDSVALGAAAQIQETLGSVLVDAVESRNMGAAPGLVEQYENSGTLGEYVVVALATNVQNFTIDKIYETIEVLPKGRRIIFVTPYGKDYMVEMAEFIRTLPDEYPFVTVADWDAAIRDHRELLAPDGLHMHTADSKQIFANCVAQAITQAGKKPGK
ncbi:MAG: acyltransferase [Clostridiales Family XIII bacterium]|jgi:peptidoglycan/LPS O-acetylase OafA/YrhL|nr:acyltransferase [Clostridiales Family XIII bacterium]